MGVRPNVNTLNSRLTPATSPALEGGELHARCHLRAGWQLTAGGALETVFEVTCGKGTYVRSLARDIGRATGWLGHVVEAAAHPGGALHGN